MKSTLLLLLAGLVVGCQQTAQRSEIDTSTPHRSFSFSYQASLRDIPEGAESIRLWIPIPLDSEAQEITRIVARGTTDSGAFTINGDHFDGGAFVLEEGGAKLTLSPIAHEQGRSLCVETKGSAIDLELSFDVTRYESQGIDHMTADRAYYLAPDSLIPLNAKVNVVASSLKTNADPFPAARELYDHTLDRMRYAKPAGGDWGRGDAEWACDSRHGNCTDFHSYFMGLARSKQIPTRFEMGFPIPPLRSTPMSQEGVGTIGGYHCWAYFWVDGRGWIPIDISEADKHPEMTDYYFGTIDENRVTMSGGRDLLLTPAPAMGTLNFFVYPYAEIDGQKATVEKKFEFTRIDA